LSQCGAVPAGSRLARLAMERSVPARGPSRYALQSDAARKEFEAWAAAPRACAADHQPAPRYAKTAAVQPWWKSSAQAQLQACAEAQDPCRCSQAARPVNSLSKPHADAYPAHTASPSVGPYPTPKSLQPFCDLTTEICRATISAPSKAWLRRIMAKPGIGAVIPGLHPQLCERSATHSCRQNRTSSIGPRRWSAFSSDAARGRSGSRRTGCRD
jgi:hypothetical protein